MRTKLLAACRILSPLLFAVACSAAHADRVSPAPAAIGPRTALAIAPSKIRAPYDVQVIREGGETAPTYALKDRFYVQGAAGERYIVRVTNPTANRVEAVVSVDGLDVVDGESGDLRKRGYVVPPYGEVRIEGFRTSNDDVATFRFSSVMDSYAGKKGKARNVGVIAVALFEEQAEQPQQIIVQPPDDGFRPPYDYEDDIDVDVNVNISRNANKSRDIVSAKDRGPSRPSTTSGAAETKRMAPPSAAPSPPPPPKSPGTGRGVRTLDESSATADAGEAAPMMERRRVETEKQERLGLGTEFGEQRYSAATFTKFVRAPGRPVAIAELRYNDAAGLMALGINVGPMPDAGEIMTRETADPFPGDQRFATPPGFTR